MYLEAIDGLWGVERGERNLSALHLMRIAPTLKVGVGGLFPKAAALGGLFATTDAR